MLPRERWQRLLDALPECLRGHICLRNVEAVSVDWLSPAMIGQAKKNATISSWRF
jgi:hypothetical protein